MTQRVYNFSAGPAVLPEKVLLQVQEEMLCLPGVGASILEISHRSGEFIAIIEEAAANIRSLLSISNDYDVLFLQGGGRLQFSMVPMNLLRPGDSADYILTGSWGKNALKEAKKVGQTRVAWDGAEFDFDRLPADAELSLDPQASFVHITSNETIEGVQFAAEPETGDVPLACDASSDFLSRPLAIDKYGLIYACAQKNVGPAGVTIVVIRKDLLSRSDAKLPGYMNYQVHAENDSLWNTAPTFPIYVVNLVTRWIRDEFGDLTKLAEANRAKAATLYDELDASEGFYRGHAVPECRSMMNVTFRLPSDELTSKFVKEAKQEGLDALKGHRSVGGVRASIYNAMPLAGVEALVDFMKDFARRHG
ncbi:MAG: 3-phosphoserine/phosphohydroxythreonine transaminase [Planctomycetales bacterium]|nr:3-phosphoserine/phosphohydroxythreonine transaminase [Planctomycetales bacterium]